MSVCFRRQHLLRGFAKSEGASPFKHKELYSEFVYKSLYDSKQGYFCNPKNIQLGRLEKPIDFSQLLGYEAYIKELSQRYPPNHFLTPSEIFRPYYGMTIARLLVSRAKMMNLKKLNIIEVGSGLGGHADSFLAYLKNSEPSLYSNINYLLVEISSPLLKESQNILNAGHSSLIKSGSLKFVNKDIAQLELKSDEPFFILMFEVLDNLCHDKITTDPDLANPMESWIVSNEKRDQRQDFSQPLAHPTIKQLFCLWKDLYFQQGKVVYNFQMQDRFGFSLASIIRLFRRRAQRKALSIYLPSSFFNIVSKLQQQLPQSEYIISDFSTLPSLSEDDSITEINKPIISRKLAKSEESKDYTSVLEPEFGSVDIFFPTDFDLVKKILEQTTGKAYTIMRPHEFFGTFAEPTWGETRSGFKPLQEDFANTRFIFRSEEKPAIN